MSEKYAVVVRAFSTSPWTEYAGIEHREEAEQKAREISDLLRNVSVRIEQYEEEN